MSHPPVVHVPRTVEPTDVNRNLIVLPDLFAMARRRFWLVLACGLAGAALAVAAGSLMRPIYKATAQLLVDPRDLKLLDNQVTPGTDVQNIGITLVENQAMVLGSDNVLGQVSQKLRLEADPEFNGTQGGPLKPVTEGAQKLLDRLRKREPEPSDLKAVVLNQLQRSIRMRRIDKTYVIELTAAAQSRDKARTIVDTVIEAYLDDLSRSRAEVARRAGEDIDSGIDALRRNVETAEQKVARYMADNNLVGVRGQIVTEQQLADINAQMITARVEVARLKARLDATPRAVADYQTVPEAVASQTLRDLRASLARISQQKAAMAAQMLPSHPVMRGIADNERQVLGFISAELGRIRQSITVEYQRAVANEKALDGQLGVLREQMNKASSAQIQLRELEREVEASRAVYRQSVTRVHEAREQARLNTANVRVISPASADLGRAFPPPMSFLAGFGFLLGLVLAIVTMHARHLARAGR